MNRTFAFSIIALMIVGTPILWLLHKRPPTALPAAVIIDRLPTTDDIRGRYGTVSTPAEIATANASTREIIGNFSTLDIQLRQSLNVAGSSCTPSIDMAVVQRAAARAAEITAAHRDIAIGLDAAFREITKTVRPAKAGAPMGSVLQITNAGHLETAIDEHRKLLAELRLHQHAIQLTAERLPRRIAECGTLRLPPVAKPTV